LVALFVLLNVLIVIAAFFVFFEGADWLSTHPLLAKYRTHLKALGTAIILAPVGVTFLRNTRRAHVVGNSIPISPEQLPELYEIYMRQCRRLELNPPPELYFSNRALKEPSHAYASWKKEFVVVGSSFLQPDLKPMLPVLAFLMGRELGCIQLGHTHWVNDLLLAYTKKVPYLKNPLERVFTLSEDRWGAFLAPEGLLAFVAMASGRVILPSVNVSAYLQKVSKLHSLWLFLSNFTTDELPIATRLHALLDLGLYRLEPGPTQAKD
jgi:hypothetical protein